MAARGLNRRSPQMRDAWGRAVNHGHRLPSSGPKNPRSTPNAVATVSPVLHAPQLRAFATDGFVVVSGVVAERFLAAADVEIDELVATDPPLPGVVGQHFYFLSPAHLPAADAALRESGALQLAEELVQPHRLDHGLDHIQVALNLPPYRHRPGGPHLDGHRPDQDRPHSFSLLAAIFLSDESRPDSGNLWVWPGSHLLHQQLFNQRGANALLPVSGHTLSLDDPPRLGSPRPVLAGRGDLLLAHYLLGHNIGGNLTSKTRRILYYRLSCRGHEDRWEQTFLDAFTEYEPVKQTVMHPGTHLR